MELMFSKVALSYSKAFRVMAAGGGGRRSTAAFERAPPPHPPPPDGPLTFRDGRHRATEPGRYKSVGFPSPESGPVVRGWEASAHNDDDDDETVFVFLAAGGYRV